MYDKQTAYLQHPLITALTLLPFLVLFELGTSLFGCPAASMLGIVYLPGMMSCCLFSILLLQRFCFAPVQPHCFQLNLLEQWHRSVYLGFIPATVVLLFGVSSSLISDSQLSFLQFVQRSETETGVVEPVVLLVLSALQAGLLEELLFRLILLTGIFGLLLGMGFGRPMSLLCAVICSSVLFAIAHDYQLSETILQMQLDQIQIEAGGIFLYRFAAGLYLSWIYLTRGLGVACGTHIVYNLTIGYGSL